MKRLVLHMRSTAKKIHGPFSLIGRTRLQTGCMEPRPADEAEGTVDLLRCRPHMQHESFHHRPWLAALLMVVATMACGCADAGTAHGVNLVSFHRDIQPIFTAKCAS